MAVTAEFIQSVVTQAEVVHDAGALSQFAVDSRSVQTGGTFIALKGENQDGHSFVQDAVSRGASGLLIQQDQRACLDALSQKQRKQMTIIAVPDTYEALYAVAAAWRQQFSYPIIGVTGSVGKTYTKEMLANMLRHAGKRCFASEGNQNTQIGVALNILDLDDTYDIAVFEVGINRRGAMAYRVELLQPTTGIITTVAHSHLAGIGSLNDIAAEKRQIFSQFKSDNIGVINGDIDILSSISYPHPVIRFGFKTTNQIQARKVQMNGSTARFHLKMYGRRHRVAVTTGHTGNVLNTLACVAACCYLGVSDEQIVSGLQQPIYIPGRYCPQYIGNSNALLIDDCYNANPASMKEAILAFERLETRGEKIAVLGDMEELGVNTSFWHRQVGRTLRKAPSIRTVILVGKYVHWVRETIPVGVTVYTASDWQEAHKLTKEHGVKDDSALLVKASRKVGLDNLVREMTHV